MKERMPNVLLVAASLLPGKGGISRVARLMARVLANRALNGQIRVQAITLADRDLPKSLPLHVWTAAGSKVGFAWAALRHGLTCSHVIYDAAPLAQTHALPLLRGKPSLVYVHGIEVWENAPTKYIKASRRMTRMLVNSAFTRHKANTLHGGFASARQCWLATEEDDAPPLAPPLNKRSPIALIVGRLVADRPKGHRELIACWPRVTAIIPDATLHIIGDGPDRSALEGLAAASSASPNIVFHGFVPDDRLAEYYSRARVYAMPSRGEGFGLVYIEAMRHGLPVIGSIHDAAPEVLASGQTGYVVDQDDSNALTTALVQLLSEPERAAEMGEAGRRRWAEHFRYSAFRDRFEILLDEFLTL